tara:strand:- start:29049 stop:29657 length:609 start_codon:yes stop_codon:yes gene_type:complete
MKKQDKYHHGGLKNKLIDDLLLAVKENTLESFSIRESARLIGVSAAAPYNHFKDKQDLIYNALNYSRNEFLEFLITDLDKFENNLNKLVLIGKNYLLYADLNPEIFNFIFSNINKHENNFYIKINDIFLEIINQNVDEKIIRTRVSLKTAANAAWSLVHGIACLISNRAINDDQIKGYIDGKLFDELSAIWAVGVSKPPKYK